MIVSVTFVYKLCVTLFVRNGLLNYITDFKQILHTRAVWPNLKDRIVFFVSGRNVVRITTLAHGVLNVSGRHCQTFSDLNPRVLLQLPLIP